METPESKNQIYRRLLSTFIILNGWKWKINGLRVTAHGLCMPSETEPALVCLVHEGFATKEITLEQGQIMSAVSEQVKTEILEMFKPLCPVRFITRFKSSPPCAAEWDTEVTERKIPIGTEFLPSDDSQKN